MQLRGKNAKRVKCYVVSEQEITFTMKQALFL